ncbi:MAG TPA: ATP-binding protein, partial [Flavisolibacter sp.]|nr:ATP-binding protein [Flavisolibacter sp.]
IKYIWSKGIYIYKEGIPVKFIGTVQDVTERKKAEQELIDKTAALQKSNESLQQFAFAASHDLKEPIRKISTYSDIILSRKEKLSEASADSLKKIHLSAVRMRQMIDDIMSYSEVLQLQNVESCNLGDIITDVMEILEQRIEENKVTIKFENLPDVKVIVSRFHILFQNLISNSIKFAKPGIPSEIEIQYKWLTSEEVKDKSLIPASKYLQVSVIDNGIGFKQDYAERIFVLFSRLHSKSDYEGSGLGLAIARRIIENHNGVLYALSKVNEGAAFIFIIPQ